ncbi:vacuolar-sorting protein SNF8-like [Patella vulgata]|uniref:vacuolar-sorting protein SNF8-like n=1 Tax=Patella vulgata TaxID=6465 RepID=UPI00217F4B59|nr:vacuolar-sorting protein SNF8-like [Patella vulgata]
MHRRGAGLGAIKNKNLAQAKYKDKGTEIAEDKFAQMTQQMDTFKTNLEDFARKHKDDIKKDPEFRLQFQEMCASIGVDPLASSKGFWAEMLGVGDFYYELAIQIVEVCIATSPKNGGLINIEELRERVEHARGRNSQNISIDDLYRAIRKLKILGSGFTVISMGSSALVQSVPGELSMDHTKILQQAQKNGFISQVDLTQNFKWEVERACRALEFMVKQGLAWVDDQDSNGRKYWFPSLCTNIGR